MLLLEINGQQPGHKFAAKDNQPTTSPARPKCAVPLDRIEIIVNGQIAQTIQPANRPTSTGGYTSRSTNAQAGRFQLGRRPAFEKSPRFRFALTGPFHIDVACQPLVPRRAETAYPRPAACKRKSPGTGACSPIPRCRIPACPRGL